MTNGGDPNGHQVKAVYTDDAGSSVTALNNVKTMVGNGIKIIFGPVAFGTALAPIEPRRGFTNFTIPEFDQLYDPKVMPSTYDTYPTPADVNNAIVKYQCSIHIPNGPSSTTGRSTPRAADLTTKSAAAAGATVVRNDTVNPTAVDFSSEP